MENQSLETKIKNALARTKQFYNGINVDWPDESCNPKIQPEITNGGWGGKRVKGVSGEEILKTF